MLAVFGGVRVSADQGDLSRGSRIQRWWRWLFLGEVNLALAEETCIGTVDGMLLAAVGVGGGGFSAGGGGVFWVVELLAAGIFLARPIPRRRRR